MKKQMLKNIARAVFKFKKSIETNPTIENINKHNSSFKNIRKALLKQKLWKEASEITDYYYGMKFRCLFK